MRAIYLFIHRQLTLFCGKIYLIIIYNMYLKVVFLILALAFLFPVIANGLEMSSTNYKILTEVASVGGATSTSSNYKIFDTLGEASGVSPTTSTSGNYIVAAGFWSAAGLKNLSATLSIDSISLGTLSTQAVASASQTLTVTTDVASGYTTYVSQDQNLTSGSNTIPALGGSSVTAGTAGYGIVTSGTAGQMNSGATPLTTSLQALALSASSVTSQATIITYKASAGASTASGSYSHTVTFTTVVNY